VRPQRIPATTTTAAATATAAAVAVAHTLAVSFTLFAEWLPTAHRGRHLIALAIWYVH